MANGGPPADVAAALRARATTSSPATSAVPPDVGAAIQQQVNPYANRGTFRTIDDLIRLAAQGASFGSIDELSAGLNALPGTVGDWFRPPPADGAANQPRGF